MTNIVLEWSWYIKLPAIGQFNKAKHLVSLNVLAKKKIVTSKKTILVGISLIHVHLPSSDIRSATPT